MKVEVHERQVEDPLAGIINDVDVQHGITAHCPLEPTGGAVAQGEAELRDRRRALRPLRRMTKQSVAMLFKGEARHGQVGLLGKVRSDQPTAAHDVEQRHAALVEQVLDDRGDSHRLASPREARHAKAHHGLSKRCRHAFNEIGRPVRKTGQELFSLAAHVVAQKGLFLAVPSLCLKVL